MNRQDNELRKRRAGEARQQKAREIGQNMAEELSRIERDILKDLALDAGVPNPLYQEYQALIFVGRIVGGELVLPWESAGKDTLARAGDRTEGLLLQAQQAEFSTGNLRPARSLLNRALNSAVTPSQRASIQVQMGRVLSKSGDEEGARLIYTEILDTPGGETDEYGIPFALFAADRLSVMDGEVIPLLERIDELIAEIRWLSSGALYLIRDVLNQIQEKSPGSREMEMITRLGQGVEDALIEVDVLQSLGSLLPTWMLRARSSIRGSGSIIWEAHGDVPWIGGISEGGDIGSSFLLVFDGPRVLNRTLTETGLMESFPGSCLMTSELSQPGLPPGEPFRGFQLFFDDMDVSSWAPSSLPFPVFYWLILFLVVGIASFGGYLVWRDVSRELAVAEMRSHFAASVSHELKTPITAIRMFAEALTMGVKQKPEAQQEYLHTIINESERLSRLLNNVLDFSKIEQGTRTYRFESIQLEEVIRAAEKAMAFPLEQKGFNLEVDIGKDIPPVKGDRDALEQAVLNLLHNAMKYSGESRKIQMKLYTIQNAICTEVKDYGIGIADEDRTAIFGKYYRVSRVENQRIPGTGLGLTIVSHIAQSHGGRIDVDSRQGEGSTFSIVIPLERP
jgi:signal transduction histidine kinase